MAYSKKLEKARPTLKVFFNKANNIGRFTRLSKRTVKIKVTVDNANIIQRELRISKRCIIHAKQLESNLELKKKRFSEILLTEGFINNSTDEELEEGEFIIELLDDLEEGYEPVSIYLTNLCHNDLKYCDENCTCDNDRDISNNFEEENNSENTFIKIVRIIPEINKKINELKSLISSISLNKERYEKIHKVLKLDYSENDSDNNYHDNIYNLYKRKLIKNKSIEILNKDINFKFMKKNSLTGFDETNFYDLSLRIFEEYNNVKLLSKQEIKDYISKNNLKKNRKDFDNDIFLYVYMNIKNKYYL